MKTCKYCREQHDESRGLVFDGFGVNGCDMYRSRIATLEGSAKGNAELGHLFAAAPDLLAALESAELSCTQARLAHDIGKKTKAEQIRFLLASFELLAKEARAAIDSAKAAV